MPAQTPQSNRLTIFAFALSGLLALTVAVLVLRQPATTSTTTAVAAAPSPAPSPAPAPAAAATPAAEAAAPTPAPSPEPAASQAMLSLAVANAESVFLRARLEDGTVVLEETAAPAQGRYERLVPAPSRVVVASLADGRPVLPATLVEVPAGATRIEASFAGAETVAVRGRVLTTAGEPLAGIPVRARRTLEGIDGSGEVRAETPPVLSDERGAYELRLPAAPRIEIFAAPGPETEDYLPSPALMFQMVNYKAQERGEMTLVLQRGETLRVELRDDLGAPVAGAEVVAQGPGTRTAKSDGEGVALLRGLSRGAYEVRVETGAHAEFRQVAVPVPGATLAATLQRVGEIGFIIRPPEGAEPAADRPAVAYLLREGAEPLEVAGSADSAHSVGGVHPGRWRLVAAMSTSAGPAVARAEIDLAPGARHDSTIARASLLTAGRGRLAGNVPPPERIELLLEDLGPDAARRGFDAADLEGIPAPRATASDLGVFDLFNLEAGRSYQFTARERESGRVLASAQFEAPLAELLVVPAGGTGTVTGTMRDPLGIACMGRRVELVVNLAVFDAQIPRPERRGATTSYDGSFRFDHVPAGRVRLVADGDARSERFVTVQSGETVSLTLPCTTHERVAFALSAADGSEIGAKETFLVMSRGGTGSPGTMLELDAAQPELRLAPGGYFMLRNKTMQRAAFEVRSNLEGPVAIVFDSAPRPEPTPVGEPLEVEDPTARTP
ncbi:MAG: carboxypeptidase-like regulatory domain-containing protein [Candidatus Sumerlaeia bacterium]|nr:carboxypeptidase-like regulatory domain-containing protein [Candidatus Sumerlaeia bacterium]